jgi:hypothetical protein
MNCIALADCEMFDPVGSFHRTVWARILTTPTAYRSGDDEPDWEPHTIDFLLRCFNNRRMARPDAVRRVKSYSAANGFVYQYCFFEVNRIVDEVGPAGEFIYAVSSDRKNTFGLRIFVRRSALEAWAQTNGRPLTSSEEYAIAKMRLFQAFDEGSVPADPQAAAALTFSVDESNLEGLLQSLHI